MTQGGNHAITGIGANTRFYPIEWLATSIAMLLCLVSLAAQSHAQEFPALSGRVVDQAQLLNPAQEAEISTKLEQLEASTQRQLVVATIADLQGYDIADYGYRLGRNWGIGDKDRNDGALLIVAPTERKMRIEVGYGLEGYLTDALSSQIIRRDITPKFKAGDFAGGINAGVDTISAQLSLSPEQAAQIVAQTEGSQSEDELDGTALFVVIAFVLAFGLIAGLYGGPTGHRHSRRVRTWGGGSSRSGSRGLGGGGFSGGGGSFGGGGASGGW